MEIPDRLGGGTFERTTHPGAQWFGEAGLGLFVQGLAMGRSLIAGALTLSLVVLPIIILATQEALRAIPDSIRHGSYALGATKWQTVRRQVLPAALPGIMTGVIIALSRAIGEAAPLIAVGAAAYVPFVPSGPTDQFTIAWGAVPLILVNWAVISVSLGPYFSSARMVIP